MKKATLLFAIGGLTILFLSTARAQTNGTKTDLAIEWANFTENGITVSIQNRGETDVNGRLETVFEWLQCGSKPFCNRTQNVYILVNEPDIPKGHRLIVESSKIPELKSWIEKRPFGVDKVRIEVDPANKIEETNETNNVWEEAPVSPRTPGSTLAKRDGFLEGHRYPSLRAFANSPCFLMR